MSAALSAVSAAFLRGGTGGVILRVIALGALGPMVLICLWVWFGLSRPSPTLVMTGFQMVLLAPAWLILVGALVTRSWFITAIATFVVVSHLVFSLPAAIADDEPAWVEGAPTFTVYAANVLYRNDVHAEVAATVLEVDADVVILNEMTEPQREALDAAGVFDRYPHEVYWRGSPFGEMLLTKLEVTDSGVENLGGMGVPWAVVDLDGTQAKVFGVHITAPKNSADRHLWRRNLDAVGRSVEGRGAMPSVYAGDFNSTNWHGPFRDLMARGLESAHNQRGQGLSRSWTSSMAPLSWLGPVMRLDHALLTEDTFATELRNLETPGSDHRGLEVTIAVNPRSTG